MTKLMNFLSVIVFLTSSACLACRLAEDSLILYENGRPVSDPQSFMIEIEKNVPQVNGGWESCRVENLKGICRKRRGQTLRSANGPQQLVLCRLPNSRSFLNSYEYQNTDPLAKSCPKTIWGVGKGGDQGVVEHECKMKLYISYIREQEKACTKLMITLPENDLGLVPYANDNIQIGFPGKCHLTDRCLKLDLADNKMSVCGENEIRKIYPNANLKF